MKIMTGTMPTMAAQKALKSKTSSKEPQMSRKMVAGPTMEEMNSISWYNMYSSDTLSLFLAIVIPFLWTTNKTKQ